MSGALRQRSLFETPAEDGAPTAGPRRTNADGSSVEAPGLGLLVDHHRLFDALAAGWLFPPADGGLVVGVGRYAPNGPVPEAGHRIPVRIRLNHRVLPEVEVPVFGKNRWALASPGRLAATSRWLYWPGPVPTFAIEGLSVSTEEQRRRLGDLADHLSDVVLPTEVSVDSSPVEESAPEFSTRESGRLRELTPAVLPATIPARADAAHGAMSMAVWAVPRNEPWIELLMASLAGDPAGLGTMAAGLEAPWWEFPPWFLPTPDRTAVELETALWLAASEVLAQRTGREDDPGDLAERIAAAAARRGAPTQQTADWLDSTRSILRSESGLHLDRWREQPVSLAVRLALLRPDPDRFASWPQALPALPPSVWWSAAALCGLHRGYRRLPIEYRGNALQRATLSVRSLRVTASIPAEMRWPIVDDGRPGWRRDPDGFTLLWGEREFARKAESHRGGWLSLDFDDPETREPAERAAKALGWNCFRRRVLLGSGRLPLSGPGALSVEDGRLLVQGSVEVRLPESARIEEGLDVGEFRRLLATEPGRVPKPPVRRASRPPVISITGIPGLGYRSEFVSESEESSIVAAIDDSGWMEELQRRVQHYGWRYDYRERTVRDSMRLGPLPRWAAPIAERLVREGLLPETPDQLIVNEYLENQGISAHTDHDRFAEAIAMVSLLESWEMVFRKSGDKTSKHPVRLERRSVAVMTGEARYDWTHEIPQRKTEPAAPGAGRSRRGRRPRVRRLSLTFRKVRPLRAA